MANFSPGWNFSRFLEQVLVKPNWRLHGEGPSPGRNSARAENPIPFWKTGLGFSAQANRLKSSLKKSHVIETEFQPRLKNRKKDGCCCYFSFKAHMEYENIKTRLNSMRLSGKHKSANASFRLRDMQPKPDRFCLHSIIIVGCWILFQKFKDWAPTKRQTTREAISLFWQFVSPCIWILLRLFAYNFIFGVEANISAQAEILHVIATKFQPC